MEIQTVSNSHINNALISPSPIQSPLPPSTISTTTTKTKKIPTTMLQTSTQQQPQKESSSSPYTSQQSMSTSITQRRCCDSPASSNSEVEKELQDLDLNYDVMQLHSGSVSLGAELNCTKSNGSLSGASTASTTGVGSSGGGDGNVSLTTSSGAPSTTTLTNGTNDIVSLSGITSAVYVRKRISSSRTPTRKARRIKFYRNGDRFYPGITIPVSNERYRSFESLFEDLTRLLEDNVKIPGAVRTIYTICGKKITSLDELEDGQSYVCSCNNENFKKIEYNTTSQPLANLTLSTKASNRLSKVYRPSSPLKNGNSSAIIGSVIGGAGIGGAANTNGCPVLFKTCERDRIVHPRIVTLIRNGTKPRKIMRLLLNKRNSPSFDHVLTAITQVVKLDTGYVRKVFTLSGTPVIQLADFFGPDDVFFAYGTERVNNPDDFKLETDEQKSIQAIRKTLRTSGTTYKGPKPKMPIKSKNIHNPMAAEEQQAYNNELLSTLASEIGIDATEMPACIRECYTLDQIIGDGNFAIVVKIKGRRNGMVHALKIIDKSKCKGKEHYIDAEVRVMKQLQHPNIISLIMDLDNQTNTFLILEYVSGGDLFDAITRVTRFSEDQSRIMIRHLASAMAYLHSKSIVHRDIKPENLLVELDDKGNVIILKLADFGLACEVTEPLYAVCGTPTYVAPEILMETGYDLKIDVWAAGIILYILLCGFPPFVAPDNQQEPLFDAIIKGVYEFPDPYWSDIGDGVRDLIANMLQSDPEVRFSSEDIFDHYWTMAECDDEYNTIGS